MTSISSINTAVTLLRSITGNQTAPQAVAGTSSDVKDALGASVQKRVDDALSAFKTGKQDGIKPAFDMNVEGLPRSEKSRGLDSQVSSMQAYLNEVESHSEWSDEKKEWKAAPIRDMMGKIKGLQEFWDSASGRAIQNGTFGPPTDETADPDYLNKFLDQAAEVRAEVLGGSYGEF